MNFKGYAQNPLASREEKPEFESVRADKTRRVGSLHWPLVRQLYMVQKERKTRLDDQASFFLNRSPTVFFVYFCSFQTQMLRKNCRLQRDSNADC